MQLRRRIENEMIRFVAILFFFNGCISVFAQEDSLSSNLLEQVIVTATRTEKKVGNVAVPIQIISQKTILQSGSLRLNDILAEQTGLAITGGGTTSSAGGGLFGSGVQLQGLSPEYTMILIDGEPIIGRQAGIINLSRITISNIKKIEIVKGPSSSLYGSDAMGGVINIITEQAQSKKINTSLRYGKFNSTDITISTSIKKEKWGMQLFGNQNSFGGFDLEKTSAVKTVDPYKNYTSQLKFNYNPSGKTKINFTGRYYNEKHDNYFFTKELGTGASFAIVGNSLVHDFNLTPTVVHQFSEKIKSSLRGYFSRYEYEQTLFKEISKSTFYYDFFQQDFYKLENQTEISLLKNNLLSIGGGFVLEKLSSTRYVGKKRNNINYFFLQNEWKINTGLMLIVGLRFDDNSTYQSKFTPKLALQYKVNEKLSINVAFGTGFKAPDYRQQYLNFLNTAAGGYVVYGANEITIQTLDLQKQQGIISEILPRASQLSLLKPEASNGLNVGGHWAVNDQLNFNFNFFRNDIKNLIQVDVIAFRNNAAPVYSYFNVKEALTQGAEFNSIFQLSKQLQLVAGYQFLITADKNDLKRIKEGTVFSRSLLNNETYKVKRIEYAGLPNRSMHSTNLKLFYENNKNGWDASIRILFRNRWGTFDKDGNGIINREDEFAKGFSVTNLTASKTIGAFRLQGGINNLFNYKDVQNLRAQPGIQPYVSIYYSIIKTKKQKLV